MRFSLAILFAFFSLNTFAQETYSFKIESRNLIWQHVFETSLSPDDVVQRLKTKGIWEAVEFVGDDLTGNSRKQAADFRSLGYNEMNIPIYVGRMDITFFALVQFQEGKYRVTVSNISLIQRYDDGISKMGEVTSLDRFAIKKSGVFKSAFLGKPAEIYNKTFLSIFELEESVEADW